MNSIAAMMRQELEQYSVLVNTRTAGFAQVIDPRIKTDIFNDGNVLRAFVALTSSSEYRTVCDPIPSKQSFIEKIMHENSIDLNEDDEIAHIKRTKMTADKGTKPLMWWNGSSDRFHHISQAARFVMPV